MKTVRHPGGGSPQLGVPLRATPTIRTRVCWGSHRGTLILGNYEVLQRDAGRLLEFWGFQAGMFHASCAVARSNAITLQSESLHQICFAFLVYRGGGNAEPGAGVGPSRKSLDPPKGLRRQHA